ncbi:uncharacterized protein LOC144167458 [Haemaphysalis longicornis]
MAHILWDCELHPHEAATQTQLPPTITEGMISSTYDSQLRAVQQVEAALERQMPLIVPAGSGHTPGPALVSSLHAKKSQQPSMKVRCLFESSLHAKKSQQPSMRAARIASLEQENGRLQSEVDTLKQQLAEKSLAEDILKLKEGMVAFYTGLPNYEVLKAVYDLIELDAHHTSRNCLLKFQEMVVFLMRLRLNLNLEDIAYRFHVSQATVTRIIYKWLDAAYTRLTELVSWPQREELQKTMPMAFQSTFGNKVAVILDCFEIFLDRPSSMEPRSLAWSAHKHHSTVKYLIGIAPQGVITYISRGWCGRTSDKLLTESCGILKNLLPGDSVLADRGFTIGDAVGMCGAKLEIPAFTKGKAQLPAYSVEATRKLANVRIHVERVIGVLRNKYSLLKSTVPLDLLHVKEVRGKKVTTLHIIVFVSAALTNVCDSVVPFD